jgi:hypothetical protein
MKNALILLFLVIPSLVLAQEYQEYRLGDTVWSPKDCVLSWTVEKGKKVEGEFKPQTTYHFTIRFHEATMTEDHLGELKFSEEEAKQIDLLLHQLVSKYTAVSTLWFLQQLEEKPNQEDKKPAAGKIKILFRKEGK